MFLNSTRALANTVLTICATLALGLGHVPFAWGDEESQESGTSEREADGAGVWSSLEYPELQVQPQASQRLLMLAQEEREGGKWSQHWPVQVSSLSLLSAAMMSSSDHIAPENLARLDEFNNARSAALTVSGVWLGGTLALSAFYHPYARGMSKINFKPRGRRQVLARERLAEEGLKEAHDLGRRLMWLSVLTHVGASIYLAEQVSSEDRPFAHFAVLTSLTPLVFQSSWIKNWQIHQTYKKRIYGPITRLAPSWHLGPRGELTPQLSYSLRF